MKQLFFASVLSLSVSAFAAPAKVVVGYFSKDPDAVFQEKTKPMFSRFAEGCSDCELRNLTPYNEKGEYDPAKLVSAVTALTDDVSFLFFNWNERAGDKNKDLVDALSAATAKGRLVIASAGVPPTNEGSCPLNKTLMGQVNDSLIIGELTEKERLLPQCYFGPEMLSAIKPPRDLIGQGWAPLQFAARLATQWNKRSASDWATFLRGRKTKTKKLWVEIEDFFPR